MDGSLLSLLMFVALFLALGLGLHISFSLLGIAFGFAYFLWGPMGMNTVVLAIWGMMNNFPLIAIPLFILWP
jgi:TRAP-type mannitol/chloroaromatic compound transport system permease large subunit